MSQTFSGIAQSGQWVCLDEFNRINIEVLSVIAQMLQDIKQAKITMQADRRSRGAAGTDEHNKFDFNGEMIKLEDSCGIFVTMNPGYAGRTELPDNLKVLFRPVSMMIPSY
jgi:dynein heavy chain